MRVALRWKLILIIAVVLGFGAVGVYPILAAHYGIRSPRWLMEKQLRLGLDLKGGVHLVLRPETDRAVRLESEQQADRLREALTTQGIGAAKVTTPDPFHLRVEGVRPVDDAAFHLAAGAVEAEFEGHGDPGGAYVFTMKPAAEGQLRADAVVRTRDTIERRVNALGVTEPSIAQQGPNGNEILVELPGVPDIDRAKQIIQSGGTLELKLVDQGPSPTADALLHDGDVPADEEILTGTASDAAAPSPPAYYLLHKVPVVTGRDLRDARASLNENSQPTVKFTLTGEGGRRFETFTSAHLGRQLAIVLDGRVHSAPRIENRISTDGNIYGHFSQQEAQDLALVLRSGALPVPLTFLEEFTIGPSLGADAVAAGLVASVVALLLVMAFMLGFYKRSGVNAVVALLINLIILLGLMASIGAVMTLPGIAGFVLTIGIGVDSNVLIFERIKEELDAKAGVRTSITAGFRRVFLTLVDTHVAALIIAACLFQFGTGSIRGFAVTLSMGLLSNLFTSTFVSHTMYEVALSRRLRTDTLSI